MPTPRFSLTDSVDNTVVDAVLAALEVHDHTGGVRLGNPDGAGTSTLVTNAGSLPGSSTYVYRYSFVDRFGFESAASTEITQSTPSVVPPPAVPVVVSSDGGQLGPGMYYVYLTAIAGTAETALSQPAIVNLVEAEGTIVTATPVEVATGTTGFRVWRQGPGEIAPTAVGGMTITSANFVDDGTVPPDDCPCDPDKQPPQFNQTNATNTITITLSDADVALVRQANSPVTRWRLYRSTTSGAFTTTSLLHQVVETGDDGKLLTSWTDDGTASLTTGTPLDTSRTLMPSIAIKTVSSGGAGALQVQSAGKMWALTADLDGSLVTDPSGLLPLPGSALYLTSPDATAWAIDVDVDGSLATTSNTPTASDEVYLRGGPVLATVDGTLGYQLTVGNDGTLSTTAVGVQHIRPATAAATDGPTQTIGNGVPTMTAVPGSIYFDRAASYTMYVFDVDGAWQTTSTTGP